MSSWLRNSKKDKADEEAAPLRSEIAAMLPPSVRNPETNRFTPLGSDAPEDVDDEDLEFLTNIASEVDRAARSGKPTPQAKPVAAPLRGASSRIDDMQVFRQMKDDGKQVTRYDHKVGDVDMADLLEELSDVQAALRQRRVA
jgi:hypothetical protein